MPNTFYTDIPADRPVLIAGPTASGKSRLAMAIARDEGGVIVNADAIQVFANWRVLTARPGPADEAAAPHLLYGHQPFDACYSVGHWLREVGPILNGPQRPIIVGGTGLYLTALTEGLADIPATPPEIRAEAEERLRSDGPGALLAMLDTDTLARIDRQNPMRIQRAWEVQVATGRGLAEWQRETPPPLLPPAMCARIAINAPKDWLSPRIEHRFDAMLHDGALEEVRANLDGWDPARQSAKAIGAPELVAHLRGDIPLETARNAAITSTRQFAKRQRTWFRARMKTWHWLDAAEL